MCYNLSKPDGFSYDNKKFLTTHVGSLPRPTLLEANDRRAKNEISDEEYNQIIQDSVDQVVAKKELGIDM